MATRTMTLSVDDLLLSSDERAQELATVASIYPELTPLTPTSATISLPVSPLIPVPVIFGSEPSFTLIAHFPPLSLTFSLPENYPADAPPVIKISASPPWLPNGAISKLKEELNTLWDDYGRSQSVFTAIDHVQSCAEHTFGLIASGNTHLTLPAALKDSMTNFNTITAVALFSAGTYECGICLTPKKGSHCHRIRSCTHVFCRECLGDYYGSLIAAGTVGSVVCSDAECVAAAKKEAATTKSGMQPPTLPPEELLDIGLKPEVVDRYIAFKQKSALDSDPSTVYCPRSWCQAASRESITALESLMAAHATSYYLPPLGTPPVPPVAPAAIPAQKLQVCSRCTLAFCRICTRSWHGDLEICRSLTAPLTEEEKANEEYLRANTTKCPECAAPVLKSHGCNHMVCKCHAHFCFLCSAYLDGREPYRHFNTRGTECYMRLWEGEEGDGQGDGDAQRDAQDIALAEIVEGLALEVPVEVPVAAPVEERPARPFVVGYIPAPAPVHPPQRPRRQPQRQRIPRAQGRFADRGDTDEDSDGEGVEFDDVPD